MNCNETKELLAQYWDLPEGDARRRHIEEHIQHCEQCAADYERWQQSNELIQQASDRFAMDTSASISSRVMRQIYDDEGWREPVPHRIYSISYKLRRKLTLLISFFLALFSVSFLYLLISEEKAEPVQYSFDGIMPVASAVGDSSTMSVSMGVPLQGVPVASLSDPFVLGVSTMKAHPDYLVAVALFGVIFTLLIMNWFSKIRA